MFDFRTNNLSAFVWLLAAVQVLMQPAAGLLHSGCEGHSHSAAADTMLLTAPQSFWQSIDSAWHWMTHSGCCQHSHVDRATANARANSGAEHSHQCSSSCGFCSRKKAETNGPHQRAESPDNQPEDSSVPSHDFHQCVICQVVFAARLNTVIVQVPTQTDFASAELPSPAPAVEIAPRFEQPTRGPPVA